MSDRLLPCPFCDSSRVDGCFVRDGWRVGCIDCGAGVTAFNPGAHTKAADKWNRRAPSPAKQAEEQTR